MHIRTHTAQHTQHNTHAKFVGNLPLISTPQNFVVLSSTRISTSQTLLLLAASNENKFQTELWCGLPVETGLTAEGVGVVSFEWVAGISSASISDRHIQKHEFLAITDYAHVQTLVINFSTKTKTRTNTKLLLPTEFGYSYSKSRIAFLVSSVCEYLLHHLCCFAWSVAFLLQSSLLSVLLDW